MSQGVRRPHGLKRPIGAVSALVSGGSCFVIITLSKFLDKKSAGPAGGFYMAVRRDVMRCDGLRVRPNVGGVGGFGTNGTDTKSYRRRRLAGARAVG